MSAVIAAEVAVAQNAVQEVKDTPSKGKNRGKGKSPNKTPKSNKDMSTPNKRKAKSEPLTPAVSAIDPGLAKDGAVELPLIGQETAAAVDVTEDEVATMADLSQEPKPQTDEPVIVEVIANGDNDSDSDDDIIDPVRKRAVAKAKAAEKASANPVTRDTTKQDRKRNDEKRAPRGADNQKPLVREAREVEVLKDERITDVKLRVRAEELVSDYIPESKDKDTMFINVELVDGANTYKMSLYSVPRSIGLSQDLRTWRGLMFGAKRFRQCDFLQLVQMYRSLSSSLNATFCEMIFDKQSMYYHTALKNLNVLGDNSAVIRDAVNSNQMLKQFLIGTLNAKRAQYVYTSRTLTPIVVSVNRPVVSKGDLNVPGDMVLDQEFLKSSAATSSDHVVIEPILGFDDNDAISEFDM